jgi:Fic family protein
MASGSAAHWEPALNAPARADRQGGAYRTYRPDWLCARPLQLANDVNLLAGQVETEVRSLGNVPGSRGLEGLARFLLRSEAIASSRIEGLQVSPQQVGLAELIDDEQLSATPNRTARRVAANIAAVRQATMQLAAAPAITVEGVVDLQRVLLPDEAQLQGLRTVQNWIGGSDYHPLDADFVPPAPQFVKPLMNDLVEYMDAGGHSALVQAGLVHAQFETIHPFRDGNGRVGRALIHTVLVRRGLTSTAVLPLSPVLLTHSQEYVGGLTAYRYNGPPVSPAAEEGVSGWLRAFLLAARLAVAQARDFAEQLDQLRTAWEQAVAGERASRGIRSAPRADSATARILANLQENPVLTAATVARLYDVPAVSAIKALDELTAAKVLSKRRLDGRTYGFLAMDVFDLLTSAERRLASTRWDTRESPPNRGTPYPPQ